MKKLKIAQVAPLWLSIPPQKYGGIEWIVYNLCEGLHKRGHNVTLFASGDSKVPCKLVSVYPRGLLKDKIPWRNHAYDLLNLSRAFKRAREFDIVHSHIDLWELFFPELVKTTCLQTIHNPLYTTNKKDTRLFIFRNFRHNNFVAISHSQKKLSSANLNFADVIYNGIRIEEFKFNPKPENYFVWSARVDKHKGIENAIEIAKRAKIKLVMAGRIDPTQINYFEEKIRPNLGKNIIYRGEYGRKEKSNFFRKAKGFLYPIEWEEPFGLVMAESMACGTPVIAFDRGSVSEVVKHGKTGFVVKNIDEAVEAVKRIGEIKRDDCRKRVEEKFTSEKMVENYEKLYYKLLKKI